jgi:hypothetical protein
VYQLNIQTITLIRRSHLIVRSPVAAHRHVRSSPSAQHEIAARQIDLVGMPQLMST